MGRQTICPPDWAAAAETAGMSPGILSGGHVFLTGVTGSDRHGLMPVDPETQFRAAFAKIAAVLDTAGADMNAVVEMTSYHLGLRDHFDTFDAVRLSIFAAPFPAWTAVEVAGLRRPGALVEIRAVACLDT